MNKHKILLPEVIADEGKQMLLSNGFDVKIGNGIEPQTLINDLADCDGVIIRIAPMSKEVIDACPKLKIIAKHGVGVDSIDLDAAKERKICVTNVRNANTVSVAEHAMALVCACAKRLPLYIKEYKGGNYAIKNMIPCSELAGKTLGVIGVGKIGAHVAKIAACGYGMNVIAYDPYLDNGRKYNDFTLVNSYEELLKNSDFVSIHVPLTASTENMIDEKQLSMMKPTAYIINTARGKIINSDALYKAVGNHIIAGAGLDVFDPEPAPTDNKIFTLDNVILTPHSGAVTDEAMVKMACGAAKAIIDYFGGKEPNDRII